MYILASTAQFEWFLAVLRKIFYESVLYDDKLENEVDLCVLEAAKKKKNYGLRKTTF